MSRKKIAVIARPLPSNLLVLP
uniref:Uncharacterized protein n=1 Tax=Arundo donax TaxID=35708 RepID=A0A0A8XRI9_ARUDO